MYDPEKLIQTKWSTRNKNYYESLDYKYTGRGTKLFVKIKDIPDNSNIRIPVVCDICGQETITPKRNYIRITQREGLYKCKPCTFKAAMEERDERLKVREYDKFLEMCSEHNCIPITTFEEFEGRNTIMMYECPKHGITGTQMGRITIGNWCYECGVETRINKLRYSPSEVKQIVESKNNNILLNPEDYINITTKNLKVLYGCCHTEKITALNAIINSNGRCCNCGASISGKQLMMSKDEMIEMATIDGKVMVINPEDYTSPHDKLLFYCDICGEPFLQSSHNYLRRGFNRCLNCRSTISHMEQEIMHVLNDFNISYQFQKTFDDLVDVKHLFFDFYLPNYNMMIEADGKQHYEPIDFFGGEKSFNILHKHDIFKDQYCIDHGYKLLRIPYTEEKNIREILIRDLKLNNTE